MSNHHGCRALSVIDRHGSASYSAAIIMTKLASLHSPLKAISLILLAVMLFASMDTAGKFLMTKFSVPLVAAVRYGINLALLTLIVAPTQGRALWQTKRTALVVLRGCSLATATFFAGLALQRMPVGETISIIYLQGFGIILAGGLLLKERISPLGWIAAIVGFAGVLLIARPGGALPLMGVIFALICATISIVYVLLSRVLAATESTTSLLFHVALAGLVIFGTYLAFSWQTFSFSPTDIALLGFLGVASLAGHYLFTKAYRFAPASMLAPFNYFHIAFAVIAGWLVYNHVPDHWALLGMFMIAASGATIALHTHFTKTKGP
jgi:drug/metabolite transporter (DMT)-like permease